jgi:hypothetical protein
MTRVLPLALVLLFTMSAGATDRYARDPEQTSLATTGRIVKIDTKNRILKVRASDGQALSLRSVSQNFTQMMQGLRQHIGVTLPGGLTISLPGRVRNTTKTPEAKETKDSPGEYTVVTTDETLFQDGGETIRFEDFKNGETISIHGVLSGSTLTASRIAKWF